VENIQAYVDRKLYIHNLGHAAVAYLGNRIIPGAEFIAECMEVPKVRERAAAAMHASAEALHRHYPEDLPEAELSAHVEDLLQRFGNHALKDTVYRVGRDVPRKLARDDRLVGPVRRCIRYGIDPAPIAACVAAALRFGATDENGAPDRGAVEVRDLLERNGLDAVLTEVCGLDLQNPEDLRAAEAIRRAVAAA
jgi:mannitol-1-phosphate 5-dehydrogenase